MAARVEEAVEPTGVVDAMNDRAIFALDAQGCVTSWSAGAQNLIGYAAEDTHSLHVDQFLTAFDNIPVRHASDVLRRAQGRASLRGRGMCTRRNGSSFAAHITLYPLLAAGHAGTGYAGVIRAMSGQPQSVLIESARQFSRFVNGVIDYAIYMLDIDGRISTWNAGAERIKGYAVDEILGQHFSCFYTEEDRATGEPARALATATREGKYEKEGWRVRKNGSRFWASVVIDSIYDESGELIGFAKVTRDITERVEAQAKLDRARSALAQSQRMEAVGRLTGGVAHDFNNLLTVIMQALDLMSSATAEGSANLRLIGNAQRAAARGALLTQQLLAFSRNQPLKPQLHDVAALIRSFVPVLQGGAGEMIELQVDSAANLGSIHVDTAQFEASLLSLVMNARDAMPHGGRIRIHVERASFSQRSSAASPELAAGSYALISVADTGGGIAPECIEHVFEPFYTTKEIGKGSGLGLSQVYGFAAQSEGGVYIASEMGSGTEVTLFLPIASDAPDAAAKPETNVRPVLGVVLLVEDDDSVRQSTVDALELLGYEVVTAAYGAQALDILRRDNRIDILFSDIVMPHGMSGVELAREAHASFPSLRILLASGHPRNAFSDSGDSTEFAFLAKPYRLQELARRLQALTPPG